MKKLLAVFVVLLVAFSSVAMADGNIDLQGMTFDELVALKDKINLAIWNSNEWQEVTVPQGVWKVGKDIPAGHWTIKTEASYATITICTALDETGHDVDIWASDFYDYKQIRNPKGKYFDETSDKSEADYDLKDGTYLIIDNGNVVFTPYAGKPSLGFK